MIRRSVPWLAVAVALCAACAPAPERPVNLLLVTIDTLRADRVSGAGYGRSTTPGLERWAARGTRFARAFSAASCTAPSHASILTGLPPGFHSVGGFNGLFPLDDGAVTLAELLAGNGFATAAVVSNPVLRRGVGLAQGFATYDDELGALESNRPLREQRADAAVAKARSLVARLPEPFFLWLHLQDPHGPYEPPAPFRRFEGTPGGGGLTQGVVLPVGDDESGHGALPRYQTLGEERRAAVYADRYDGEIAYADDRLAGLLDELEATGLLARTLLAVTSDHGEAQGEDGFWFAHGHSVGLDQVRVPLFLTGPGIPPGRVVEAPVANAALFNTALAAFGFPEAGGDSIPALDLDALGPARPVFVESLNQVGVAAGRRYLSRDRRPAADLAFWSAPNPTTGGFWKPLGIRLAALGRDRLEFLPEPDAAERLTYLLDSYEKTASEAAAALAAGRRQRLLSDEERAALRALGYAGR